MWEKVRAGRRILGVREAGKGSLITQSTKQLMDHPDGANSPKSSGPTRTSHSTTAASGGVAVNPSELGPLPEIGISEILGLVEFLKSKGGREDIYKLANELQMEAGDVLTVLRGAELLGLVHTPGGDVEIEKMGETVTRSRINERKSLIKNQLHRIAVFKAVTQFLHEADDKQVTRDQLLEKLAEILPNENCEQLFSTVVNWGRYAELFGYNDDTETFYLDEGQETHPSG